jgi:DNA-binding GntR family transcriptional regulator
MQAGTDPAPAKNVEWMPALLGQGLVQVLEQEIIHLRFAPGARLVEEELCQRFGISRSPVREALQVLAGYGLVERRPRRGMFVTDLSVRKLDEIYACRAPLEGLAAAGVASRATPETVNALEAHVAEMRSALADDRREAVFAANVALTDVLHRECGNETLRTLLAGLDKQALRYRFYCYRRSRELLTVSTKANTKLVAAIKAHAGDAARETTEGLINRSWKMIRDEIARSHEVGQKG